MRDFGLFRTASGPSRRVSENAVSRRRPCHAGKNIEVWMVELNLAMCAAVRDHMIRAVRAYPDTQRTRWMLDWPGQVVLNGSQVHWTLETEKALAEKGNQGVYDYYEQIKSQLADMVGSGVL